MNATLPVSTIPDDIFRVVPGCKTRAEKHQCVMGLYIIGQTKIIDALPPELRREESERRFGAEAVRLIEERFAALYPAGGNGAFGEPEDLNVAMSVIGEAVALEPPGLQHSVEDPDDHDVTVVTTCSLSDLLSHGHASEHRAGAETIPNERRAS